MDVSWKITNCSAVLADMPNNGSFAYCSNNSDLLNVAMSAPIARTPPPPSGLDIAMVVLMGIICVAGLLGNGLVIFVIARNTMMKTVTNIFILNLSIADSLFLIGIPMAMTTTILKHWIFGEVMCKLYYILTCINMFTGAFTLTMMSGDRFLAVRYPLHSMDIRTSKYAVVALLIIWSVSLVFIIPVLLYTRLIMLRPPYESCTIVWPAHQEQIGQKLYITYTLLLGFAIPISIITVLYSLLILRLKRKSRSLGLSSNKRSHAAKVTKLVTVIISVFILCWLPYWVFQTYLILTIPRAEPISKIGVCAFQIFTVLSFANSMVNPILYAYTNDSFRDAFNSVFICFGPLMKRKTSKQKSTRKASECTSLVVARKNRLEIGNSGAVSCNLTTDTKVSQRDLTSQVTLNVDRPSEDENSSIH